MRRRVPITLLVALAAVLALVVMTIAQNLQNVPRVRVGPLVAKLPVPEGRDTLRFFALGDSGTGGDAQYAVARAMEARCAATGGLDGILQLGDNAYQSGFESVDDPDWQSKIVAPYGTDCLAHARIFPVLGNHDYKGNTAAQIEYSLLNPRWHFPNRFYSVEFGDLARLVAFDSQPSDFCLQHDFCTGDFALAETGDAAAPVRWNVVLAHHPLKSSSVRGGGHSGDLRGLLLRPLFCNRVDAWLAGHSHHLEHLVLPECRMELFVSGGGGADLYSVEPGNDPEVRFAASAHGFLELEVTKDAFTSRFIGTDGQVLHESTRRK